MGFTGFQWVPMGFPGRKPVEMSLKLDFNGLDWVQVGFNEFNWV